LSEIESPLTQELKNYFRERIASNLTTGAYDVEFDSDSASPVPGVVSQYLGDGRAFVKKSVPTGLLILARVLVAGERALAILKLEKEEGVRVKEGRIDDKRTFNIEHLRDLMLTDRTRVFKVGFFVKRDGPPVEVQGVVSDKQRGYLPRTEVADFFLRRFLGCRLLESPDISTKRFFNATEDFINEAVADPVRKARYHIALLAELNSASGSLRPRTFAQHHLDVNDRQPYISFLEGKGVPTTAVQKDSGLISAQLQRLQMDFASGLAVLGSPEAFADHVQVSELEGGQTRVEIHDRLSRVHGRK
jgi:hypothetical protein